MLLLSHSSSSQSTVPSSVAHAEGLRACLMFILLTPHIQHRNTSSQWLLVAQWCSNLCDTMGCSLPGSSIHGILQAKILEWIAIPFSRRFPDPGIKPGSPALQADFFYSVSLPSKPQTLSILSLKHTWMHWYLPIYCFFCNPSHHHLSHRIMQPPPIIYSPHSNQKCILQCKLVHVTALLKPHQWHLIALRMSQPPLQAFKVSLASS